MRKAFAIVFCILEYVVMIVSAMITYKAYSGNIQFDLGVLIVVPLMIMSYWFSTFFHQLAEVNVQDGTTKDLVNTTVKRILTWVSNLITVVIILSWVYIALWQLDYIKFHL
ncbi:MAG: hypothetical protein ACI4RC_06470 [Oscillospiraceae bacterium]